MRYWWGHYEYGNHNFAWCNICDVQITGWLKFPTMGPGVPIVHRKKIEAHRLTHG